MYSACAYAKSVLQHLIYATSVFVMRAEGIERFKTRYTAILESEAERI